MKDLVKVTGAGNISATIIKDSVSSVNGQRVTTFELEYPRFILAELNTHRMFSRNSSSSRAVPLERAADHVKNNMADPIHFGSRKSGMQSGEELKGWRLKVAKVAWKSLGHVAVLAAKGLAKIGAHKSWASRPLEAFQMMRSVLTATEMQNFLWLRDDEAAQPEIRVLAQCIKEALEKSEPDTLYPGMWHLPYIETEIEHYNYGPPDQFCIINDEEVPLETAKKVSVSSIAQVSFRRLDQSIKKAERIYDMLIGSEKIHASPFESVLTPMEYPEAEEGRDPLDVESGTTHVDIFGKCWSGNAKGFIQMRSLIPNNVKRG